MSSLGTMWRLRMFSGTYPSIHGNYRWLRVALGRFRSGCRESGDTYFFFRRWGLGGWDYIRKSIQYALDGCGSSRSTIPRSCLNPSSNCFFNYLLESIYFKTHNIPSLFLSHLPLRASACRHQHENLVSRYQLTCVLRHQCSSGLNNIVAWCQVRAVPEPWLHILFWRTNRSPHAWASPRTRN